MVAADTAGRSSDELAATGPGATCRGGEVGVARSISLLICWMSLVDSSLSVAGSNPSCSRISAVRAPRSASVGVLRGFAGSISILISAAAGSLTGRRSNIIQSPDGSRLPRLKRRSRANWARSISAWTSAGSRWPPPDMCRPIRSIDTGWLNAVVNLPRVKRRLPRESVTGRTSPSGRWRRKLSRAARD